MTASTENRTASRSPLRAGHRAGGRAGEPTCSPMLAAGSGRAKNILPVVRGGQDVADQRERAGHAHDPVRIARRWPWRARPAPTGRPPRACPRAAGPRSASGEAARGFADAVRMTRAASGRRAARMPPASLSASTPITKVTGRPGKYARSDAARARAPAGLWAPSRMTSGSRRKIWNRPGQRAPPQARADRALVRPQLPRRRGREQGVARLVDAEQPRRPRRRIRQPGPSRSSRWAVEGESERGDAQVAALERAAAPRPRAARRVDDRRGLRVLPRREGHPAPDDRRLLGRRSGVRVSPS